MSHSFTTPMMKQYMRIKEQYQDCLMFFRMGDFYELFLEDAHIGAKILDITLTSRAKGRDGRVPMAGVPYHSVDTYLSKLVKAGHKVAICDQLSPPDKNGIVERDVIRVVTPGTVLDEKSLEQKENNYIISLTCDTKHIGISCADISTGQFHTAQFPSCNPEQIIIDELSRLTPSECILNETQYNDPWFLKILKSQRNLNIFLFPNWDMYAQDAHNFLKKHFGITSLMSFGIKDKPHALTSSAALLGYLKETQKDNIHHITHIRTYDPSDHMNLDRSTMVNLELFSTLRDHERKGSLISVLDKTETAMGGRLLRTWIRKPLTNKSDIQQRLDAVEELLSKTIQRNDIQQKLHHMTDIERALSRLSVGVGNARDLVQMKHTLRLISDIKTHISSFSSPLLKHLHSHISDEIQQVIDYIETTITDEPPLELKQGNLIKPGVDPELDRLKNKITKGKNWLGDMEKQERKRTGISSLKVGFNNVFGYYIEVSKANTHLVPHDYMRKQTLVNGERYITPELKEQEDVILSARDTSYDIEYRIFCSTLEKVLAYTPYIQNAAEAIATLDCLFSFALLAEEHQYTKPEINAFSREKGIDIEYGRHPVVEQMSEDSQFVPNNTTLDQKKNQLLIITGPNMAGKSVYIRQVALIVLMAQIGCYVPAQKACISLVDRIFVRSGASDMITSGLSTFMVEMVETAHILRHATEKSLIIMDEIGRGTSTYDGISIAWAIAEYLVKQIKAKTLFATHYHELQNLEQKASNHISNYHMGVQNEKGNPVFLYTLLPGGSSHSHGVAVAQLAGVPAAVITRAKEILDEMEE